MLWLKDRFINEGRALAGVVCCESSSYINGLSTFPPSPLLRFLDMEVGSNRIRYVTPNRTLPITEDIEHVAGHLYATNKERTICDMILYESNDEFIYESIETYLALHGTEETLRTYALKYNCVEKMEHYLTTLDAYLAEEY